MKTIENLVMTEIKIIRIKNGISAKKLSLMIGKSPNYISKAENGYFCVSLNSLFKILKIFDITPHEFFRILGI